MCRVFLTAGLEPSFPVARRSLIRLCLCLFLLGMPVAGCAHYPVNKPLEHLDPEGGYRGRNRQPLENNDDSVLLFLTFSGGGTRAAAFAYGVLEELRRTEVTINGKPRRLLDEVDGIAGVSGGSFTAAYYGLYGDRIFKDFEEKFLKKNIEGALVRRIIFNPANWVRFISPVFDRSDVAANYYDEYVFDHGTFSDMARRAGPMISINATDMTLGNRVAFTQDSFDVICSDLSSYPVARACAASSAVPILLTPITLRNYAGSCGYELPENLRQNLESRDTSTRQFSLASNLLPYLDGNKKPYIHLVDGGVADNLGLRAVLDRVILMGDPWTTLKETGLRNAHKIVFIVVNAEKGISTSWDHYPGSPPLSGMIDSYSSIAIERYNVETIALLRESIPRWTDEIRKGRCPPGQVSTEPGTCGDIRFYLIEVKFEALRDAAEREHLMSLPTSFSLKTEDVDKLREAAHQILTQSEEFQQLLRELR